MKKWTICYEYLVSYIPYLVFPSVCLSDFSCTFLFRRFTNFSLIPRNFQSIPSFFNLFLLRLSSVSSGMLFLRITNGSNVCSGPLKNKLNYFVVFCVIYTIVLFVAFQLRWFNSFRLSAKMWRKIMLSVKCERCDEWQRRQKFTRII